MAASYPPADNATLKALNKGDVGALEKIYRASYATIIADVAKQAGDPSFGPTRSLPSSEMRRSPMQPRTRVARLSPMPFGRAG